MDNYALWYHIHSQCRCVPVWRDRGAVGVCRGYDVKQCLYVSKHGGHYFSDHEQTPTAFLSLRDGRVSHYTSPFSNSAWITPEAVRSEGFRVAGLWVSQKLYVVPEKGTFSQRNILVWKQHKQQALLIRVVSWPLPTLVPASPWGGHSFLKIFSNTKSAHSVKSGYSGS